jgi:release factor glutamine methyltransferase
VAGCVYADDEAALLVAAATAEELADLVARRVAGAPLEHVLGWADFRGSRVAVDPGVFVPRRRTELLARLAARCVAAKSTAALRPVVVDLCCGSGAVGVALLAGPWPVELHAVDIDPAAVRCAARNLGAGGAVYCGDLSEPLPSDLRGRVDVLLANAPYVPTAELALLPAEARMHEPIGALDGGRDGLDVARRIVAGAPNWLTGGGCLLVETSERQSSMLAQACADVGLAPRVARSRGLDATVVIGTGPS